MIGHGAAQMFLSSIKTDRHIFFYSTTITVGNGKGSLFWEIRWLQGVAPKDLAPNLYNQAKLNIELSV